MAKSKRKGKKLKPWTSQEEDRLIANVEKHYCAFKRHLNRLLKKYSVVLRLWLDTGTTGQVKPVVEHCL